MPHRLTAVALRALSVAALGLAGVDARADVPQPSVTAPRAILVDMLGNDVLFEKAADQQTLQGSIAKILTAGAALSAARDGSIALDDVVPISARAQRQACTCLQDQNGDGVSDVQVGERFVLEDLLHAVLMRSAGESTDAVAEHVAAALAGPVQGADRSERLMNFFLGLMNRRASQIPLHNSRFVTVHGGDLCDFAIGCTPDCEDLSQCLQPPECAQNGMCEPSGTTARDLARLWRDIATVTPEFIDIAGRRNIVIPSGLNGQLKSYPLSQNFPYSPGVDADKGGNSGLSQASLIAQATWLGRSLVSVVLNAPSNAARDADTGALFDFGYATIFEPEHRVTSTPLQPVRDHALVCASRSRAVSAFITESTRQLRLVTWNVDVGDGRLEELKNELGLVMVNPALPLEPLGLVNPGILPGGLGDGPVLDSGLKPDEVDAAHMGGGIVVVAVRKGSGVSLMTWGIARDGPPFVINGGVVAGKGADARIEPLNKRVLVSALRDTTGAMVLRTWRVSADGASIEPLAEATTLPQAQEFDLATHRSGSDGRVLTVARDNAGRRVTRSWLVNLQQGGAEGAITHVQSRRGPQTTQLAALRVPVPLESPSDAAFVTAERSTSGKLRLVLWSVDQGGALAPLGGSGSTGPDVAPDDRIALAPMREAGVLSVVGTGVHARLMVWGLDPENPLDGFNTPFPVVDGSQVAGDLLGACSVPSADAEGDVLLAYRSFFDQGGPLKLSAWRNGPRP